MHLYVFIFIYSILSFKSLLKFPLSLLLIYPTIAYNFDFTHTS